MRDPLNKLLNHWHSASSLVVSDTTIVEAFARLNRESAEHVWHEGSVAYNRQPPIDGNVDTTQLLQDLEAVYVAVSDTGEEVRLRVAVLHDALVPRFGRSRRRPGLIASNSKVSCVTRGRRESGQRANAQRPCCLQRGSNDPFCVHPGLPSSGSALDLLRGTFQFQTQKSHDDEREDRQSEDAVGAPPPGHM